MRIRSMPVVSVCERTAGTYDAHARENILSVTIFETPSATLGDKHAHWPYRHLEEHTEDRLISLQ